MDKATHRYHELVNMTKRLHGEIAERIGISQMHVSRLLTASLAHLRKLVDDEEATRSSADDYG